MNEHHRRMLFETRFRRAEAIAEAAARRRRRQLVGANGKVFIVAADHRARGMIDLEPRDMKMANRYELLDRLVAALSVPSVDGVLGTPDVIEDLLLLGALEDKVVFGSMNRGGLPGSAFEMDDRFTSYTPDAIADMSLDGGKMLLRIDPQDPATVRTLEACGGAISRLASHRLVAMVEPFMVTRQAGRARNDLSTEAVVRSISIAAALGTTSAYTWLKVPVLREMDRIVEAATAPLLLLGGERTRDPDELFGRWEKALSLPGVCGLVVGRNLLYPPDGDVASAVGRAASLL
jgi:DhnA family fructose-bisphosphate aldolase class Ia